MDANSIPLHPCLRIVANSEDKLTLLLSRRLITMEKIAEYEMKKREMYREVTRKSLIEQGISYNDLMKTVGTLGRCE